MSKKAQLILDIGGVLATNLTAFWQEIARKEQSSYQTVRKKYKAEMSDKLWKGEVTEEQFWNWIEKNYHSLQRAHAKNTLTAILKPLPAIQLLPTWSKYAYIHILSNHRLEWVKPIISRYHAFITSMTVSCEYGCSKPDPAIYQQVKIHTKNSDHILFIDDSQKNLHAAEELGWQTLLADESGAWTQQVLPLINADITTSNYNS